MSGIDLSAVSAEELQAALAARTQAEGGAAPAEAAPAVPVETPSPATAGTSPADPQATLDVAAVAEENARLRAELLAENERLRALVAESQAAGAAAQGLTDEDVRRLEHPEEFVQAENEAFRTQLATLQAQVAALQARAAAPSA